VPALWCPANTRMLRYCATSQCVASMIDWLVPCWSPYQGCGQPSAPVVHGHSTQQRPEEGAGSLRPVWLVNSPTAPADT
jgi:hypothetical protein